jgi:D-amino-acid dehydrogenase
MAKNVVVIGAGVIGLCSAYYLAEQGHQVTLVDKDEPLSGRNCSMGNQGMIVPSHFVPLAAPGIISQGLLWMMNPSSPFYIRPRLSKELFSWLLRFYKSSNKQHVERSAPAIKAINSRSLELFKNLNRQRIFDFAFEQKGLLLICKTGKCLEEEKEMTHAAGRLGLETVVLDKNGLRKQEPDIDIQAEGGVLYPGDAHLSPALFVQALYEYLRRKPNVRFQCGSPVVRFTVGEQGICSVQTQAGSIIQGDEFVLASGSASGQLVKQLDLPLPMESGKGYSLTVRQQEQRLATPSILCEARVAITPLGNNEIRFGGTMELGGEAHTIRQSRLDGIIGSVSSYFPGYNTAVLERCNAWSGLRPCPPDGLPYIGRFSRCPNLIAATGHSMMGLSLAPATGEIVAAIVSGTQPVVDTAFFSPDRFDHSLKKEPQHLLIRT